MQHFFKETFRPNTEAERQTISRYHRQRAIVGLIAMMVMLIAMAIILLPMGITRARLAGTWIAFDEHADGFQPEDAIVEFKDGVFYRNGKNAGMPVTKNGQTVITVHTPAGQYEKYLSVKDDILTIEYTPPTVIGIYTGSRTSLPDWNGSLTYATAVAVQQSQQDTGKDRRVVEIYVRISNQCGLTEDERAALY
ncbi:MAG: hypothetical protein IKC28_08655 [Clostridia bacterium]|nr:hypothetical protein [Clostridia bacterium]